MIFPQKPPLSPTVTGNDAENNAPSAQTDPDLIVVLRHWPQLAPDVRRIIVRLVVECPAPDVAQQQLIKAALEQARDIERALDRMPEPIDS